MGAPKGRSSCAGSNGRRSEGPPGPHLRNVRSDNCGVTPMGTRGRLGRGSVSAYLVSHVFRQQMVRQRTMWFSTQSELRELVWLASVVGALSILGTGLAVALAMVLVV